MILCTHEFEVWRGRDICINCGQEKKYNTITETGARSYGMIHDPLCSHAYEKYDEDCHECTLIAKAYRRGYEDALEDMSNDSV